MKKSEKEKEWKFSWENDLKRIEVDIFSQQRLVQIATYWKQKIKSTFCHLLLLIPKQWIANNRNGWRTLFIKSDIEAAF